MTPQAGRLSSQLQPSPSETAGSLVCWHNTRLMEIRSNPVYHPRWHVNLQPLVISFSHSSFPPFPLLCPCSPNETDQRQDYPLAGSLSTPHTPLHLPWETHLRCLATWRALCYCREKHSRARLTPHRITPFSLLPLWLSNQLNVFCVEHLRTWGRGCQPSTSCNHFGSALNLQLPEQIETEIHRLQVCAVINLRHFWLLKEKSCTWKGFR